MLWEALVFLAVSTTAGSGRRPGGLGAGCGGSVEQSPPHGLPERLGEHEVKVQHGTGRERGDPVVHEEGVERLQVQWMDIW